MTSDERRGRLSAARLYLVIESTIGGESSERVVAAAVEGGVHVVQLRDKAASDARIVEAARRLGEVCAEHGALLVVNDRPDLAVEAGADGVHVGQDDAPVDEVRATVGPELLVGLSTHSPAQIDAAGDSGADYLGVGPIYPTATKPGRAAVGVGLVRYASARARQPFFAIGGIDVERARDVAAAGAKRIAVVRAIRDAGDPREAARGLRAALEREAVGGAAR